MFIILQLILLKRKWFPVCAEKHLIFLPKTDKSVATFDRGKSLIANRKPKKAKRAFKISDIKKPGVSIFRLLCTRSLAFEFDEFNSIIIK